MATSRRLRVTGKMLGSGLSRAGRSDFLTAATLLRHRDSCANICQPTTNRALVRVEELAGTMLQYLLPLKPPRRPTQNLMDQKFQVKSHCARLAIFGSLLALRGYELESLQCCGQLGSDMSAYMVVCHLSNEKPRLMSPKATLRCD